VSFFFKVINRIQPSKTMAMDCSSPIAQVPLPPSGSVPALGLRVEMDVKVILRALELSLVYREASPTRGSEHTLWIGVVWCAYRRGGQSFFSLR